MNRRYQLGSSFRAGVAVGAGLTALLLVALVGFSSAGDWSTTIFGGGISADKLGGVGSMKSSIGVDVGFAARDESASVMVWRIAEKLDDDIGISPVSGGTIAASRRIAGPWRLGALYAWTDVDRFAHATVGLGTKNANIDWLVPVNDSRFGLRAQLLTPISRCWSAQVRYEYLGRQDPDIKLSTIGIGLRRSLSACGT